MAMELMAEMRSRAILANVHTYSAMMNVCIKCGEVDTALDVYRQLQVRARVTGAEYLTCKQVGSWCCAHELSKSHQICKASRAHLLKPKQTDLFALTLHSHSWHSAQASAEQRVLMLQAGAHSS